MRKSSYRTVRRCASRSSPSFATCINRNLSLHRWLRPNTIRPSLLPPSLPPRRKPRRSRRRWLRRNTGNTKNRLHIRHGTAKVASSGRQRRLLLHSILNINSRLRRLISSRLRRRNSSRLRRPISSRLRRRIRSRLRRRISRLTRIHRSNQVAIRLNRPNRCPHQPANRSIQTLGTFPSRRRSTPPAPASTVASFVCPSIVRWR